MVFRMKNTFAVVLVAAALFAACKENGVIRVGLVGEELAPAWEEAKKVAARDGIIIDFVKFSDYAVPNRALTEGEIDLNSFQHNAFFEEEISNRNYSIEPVGNTVLFFMGVYSHKIKSLDELKQGDTIVVMNDATNEGRAMKVLEAAGVFQLDPLKGNMAGAADIISNPKNIKIVEVDASQVYRTLDDPQVAAAVSNSTFVVDAGGNPLKDSIFHKPIDEVADRPYINIIVARSKDKNKPFIEKVVAAFQSPEVKRVIDEEKPLAGIAITAW